MAEHRRFVLQRNEDISGVSGTGVVAEGVEFSNGVVALHWTSDFPTSVVFHHRGMESVEHVHGHSGATRIVWIDASEKQCRLCWAEFDTKEELEEHVEIETHLTYRLDGEG